MKIEILGTGCHRCIILEKLLFEVLGELGRSDVSVEWVSDESTIRMFMPLDAIPGLVIDGRVVLTGDVPSKEVLTAWLESPRSEPTMSHSG